MTQEEKQLLIIDLCERLPYNIYVEWNDGYALLSIDRLKSIVSNVFGDNWKRPYLRSLSNMTKDERYEFEKVTKFTYYPGHVKYNYIPAFDNNCTEFSTDPDPDYRYKQIKPEDIIICINWLNSHYFDYRGLIEKGLALEAPEGMYG